MPTVATRLTRVALTGDQTISADTIRVHEILVSNATNNAVEVVFTNNDAIPILNITVPAQDSHTFEPVWIADNGLLVSGAAIADANVVVTVAHSYPGS